jgi:hypothetical protein
MPRTMKKVPSYLKGLAEERARAAAEAQRLDRVLADVTARLAEAKLNVAACDRLIRKFDPRLDPTTIPPIRAHKKVQGPRGTLKSVVVEMLRASAPGELTTNEICWELQVRYQLDFETGKERWNWQHGSIGRLLKHLVKEGVVERLHDPLSPIAEVGRWRLKTDAALSVDHLKAQAEASGTSVLLCDDDPD